jgi:hypothetical protein
MLKDFQFIKDYVALDTYVGYAIWEMEEDEALKYIIFKYSIDLKEPNQIEIEAEITRPGAEHKEIVGTVSIILDLLTCSAEDFVKKIQQSIRVICVKNKELAPLYRQMGTMFEISDIYGFYSDIDYILKDKTNE